MGRKTRKEIIRTKNREKPYKPKARKRPRGWHRGNRKPAWAIMRDLNRVKRSEIEAWMEHLESVGNK